MLDHVNTESTKHEPYIESQRVRESESCGDEEQGSREKKRGVGDFPRDVYNKLKVNTPDRSGGEEVDRLTEVVFLRRKPGIMRTTALGGRSSRRTLR